MEVTAMIDSLLDEIEQLVGSYDFEYEMEEIMNRIEAEGAGFEIVEKLLGIMERHPLDDFGMPGAMVHFIENYHPEYIPILINSIKRSPALHTVWMLNRCINGSENKEEYINLLKQVADDEKLDKAIRESAQEFVDYQLKR